MIGNTALVPRSAPPTAKHSLALAQATPLNDSPLPRGGVEIV
jgi:hypothetical protein